MSLFSSIFRIGQGSVNLSSPTYRITENTFAMPSKSPVVPSFGDHQRITPSTLLPAIKPSTQPIGTFQYLNDTALVDLLSRNEDHLRNDSSNSIEVSSRENYNDFLKNDLLPKLDISNLTESIFRDTPTFTKDFLEQLELVLDVIGVDENDDEDEVPTEIVAAKSTTFLNTSRASATGDDKDNIFKSDPSVTNESYEGQEGIDTFITKNLDSYYELTHYHYSNSTWLNHRPDFNSRLTPDLNSYLRDTKSVRLSDIERIEFANKNLAFDLEGNAGTVAKIYGAILGKDSILDPELIGTGLKQIDNGLNPENFAAITIKSTGFVTSEDIVHLLWTNVVGTEPTTEQARPYIDILDKGEMSIGELGLFAANHFLNKSNIDLVGLQSEGIAYS